MEQTSGLTAGQRVAEQLRHFLTICSRVCIGGDRSGAMSACFTLVPLVNICPGALVCLPNVEEVVALSSSGFFDCTDPRLPSKGPLGHVYRHG